MASYYIFPASISHFYCTILNEQCGSGDLPLTTLSENQGFRRFGKSFEKLQQNTRFEFIIKKILTISQYVTEAFKILTHKKLQQFDTQIQDIISNLKAENISEANAGLIALLNSVMEQIEDHIQTLGFEVKYPRRLRYSEATKAILSKVFPQFMVFMIWIGLVILLAHFGIIRILSPP